MKKIIDSLYKNNEISDQKAMLVSILYTSTFLVVCAIIIQCILLPIWETNHQDRIKKLDDQLSGAESAEEAAVINVLIKMENDDWEKEIAANHTAYILSLGTPIVIFALFIIYVILSKITNKLFDKIL